MLYRVIVAVYGAILVAGGAVGFAKAGSVLSLVVGGLSGLAMLAFAFAAGRYPGPAMRGAAFLSLALLGFWVYRVVKVSGEGGSIVMPAMNIALAAGVFIALGLGHMAAMRRRQAEEAAGQSAS